MTARGLHIIPVWYGTFMFDFIYNMLLKQYSMVLWLLVELKPNCQHHCMALPMPGAVLGCHGDPPQVFKVG